MVPDAISPLQDLPLGQSAEAQATRRPRRARSSERGPQELGAQEHGGSASTEAQRARKTRTYTASWLRVLGIAAPSSHCDAAARLPGRSVRLCNCASPLGRLVARPRSSRGAQRTALAGALCRNHPRRVRLAVLGQGVQKLSGLAAGELAAPRGSEMAARGGFVAMRRSVMAARGRDTHAVYTDAAYARPNTRTATHSALIPLAKEVEISCPMTSKLATRVRVRFPMKTAGRVPARYQSASHSCSTKGSRLPPPHQDTGQPVYALVYVGSPLRHPDS
mmetsp:Transcript_41067/g.96659  ORF Transcript_41067/g.96659 Transcript_41067/m.96659 type:complete len:277 (-) Transcript_41067:16-846(-)